MPDEITKYIDDTPIAHMAMSDLLNDIEATHQRVTPAVHLHMDDGAGVAIRVGIGTACPKTKIKPLETYGQLQGWLKGIEWADGRYLGLPPLIHVNKSEDRYGWDCSIATAVDLRSGVGEPVHEVIATFADLAGAIAFSDACLAMSAATALARKV